MKAPKVMMLMCLLIVNLQSSGVLSCYPFYSGGGVLYIYYIVLDISDAVSIIMYSSYTPHSFCTFFFGIYLYGASSTMVPIGNSERVLPN